MAKAKIDLSVVRERNALRPQPNRAPYWQRLRPGLFLGYRPAPDGAAGTWSAKTYVDATERQHALESFGQFAANERFAKAKAAAETIMAREETGGRTQALLITVADAARDYVKTRPDAERFFKLGVYEDPIAKIELHKLRRRDLAAWRERMEGRVQRGRGEEAASRRRTPASVNREMTPLRAALRKVLPPGQPNTEAAWQEALKKIPAAQSVRRRTLYLEKQERQALLANISADAEPFARALCLLPVRPGALAQLVVGDFDKKTGVLTIRAGIDKAHPERQIHVSAAAAALLIAQSRDKTPATPLFLQANRKAWDRHSWKFPIRAAVIAAKLPATTSAYTLRHCVLTDLVVAGVPTLTIAQLAGTSVKMIEDHYGHLLQDAARRALETLAL